MKKLFLLLALGGCSAAGTAGNTSDTASLRAQVTKLETEARAMAKTEGCSSVNQCKMAPVGNRACGGPRLYIPYCAASTDSVALFKKLDELKDAETRLNQATGAVGTCDFKMPPVPVLGGGRCGP